MTQAASSPAPQGQVPRARFRRLWLRAFLLAGAVMALGLGWYGWHRHAVPVPPEIHLEGVDPVLVEAFTTERRKVLEDPYSAAAWGRLGKVLRMSGFLEEASTCFAQAGRLDPSHLGWPYLCGEALLLRNPDAALPHLRRAVELCNRADVDTLAPRLRLAEVLLARGEYDEAEPHLRRALEADPENPTVHLDLGLLAYERDDLATSRAHLLRCQDSLFTRQKACARLAEVSRRQGHEEEAVAFSRRAAALPPDLPWADPYLAGCLELAAGKSDRFRRIEQLEAQAGEHPEARRQVVLLLGELLEQAPDYRAYVALGNNLARLGDYQGAEQALRAAVGLAPDNFKAYHLLSVVLLAQGEQRLQKAGPRNGEQGEALSRFQTAAAYARQAAAHKPDHALTHMVLGLALKHLGRREEALAALRTAVQCGPDLAAPHLHLGEMLAEVGREKEARVCLERAVRLGGAEGARARAALEQLSRRDPSGCPPGGADGGDKPRRSSKHSPPCTQ